MAGNLEVVEVLKPAKFFYMEQTNYDQRIDAWEQFLSKQRVNDAVAANFLTKVYGWMCFALFLTALTAWAVSKIPIEIIKIYPSFVISLLLLMLGLYFGIPYWIDEVSTQTATALFIVYSVVTGVVSSYIFVVYTKETIVGAFVAAGLTFGIMSFYGFATNKDLTSSGNLLLKALSGLIIATVWNIFWGSTVLCWFLTYAGIIIFTGLTAACTQELKKISYEIKRGESANRQIILGALTLYLNFTILFRFLLRIFGRRYK